MWHEADGGWSGKTLLPPQGTALNINGRCTVKPQNHAICCIASVIGFMPRQPQWLGRTSSVRVFVLHRTCNHVGFAYVVPCHHYLYNEAQ